MPTHVFLSRRLFTKWKWNDPPRLTRQMKTAFIPIFMLCTVYDSISFESLLCVLLFRLVSYIPDDLIVQHFTKIQSTKVFSSEKWRTIFLWRSLSRDAFEPYLHNLWESLNHWQLQLTNTSKYLINMCRSNARNGILKFTLIYRCTFGNSFKIKTA